MQESGQRSRFPRAYIVRNMILAVTQEQQCLLAAYTALKSSSRRRLAPAVATAPIRAAHGRLSLRPPITIPTLLTKQGQQHGPSQSAENTNCYTVNFPSSNRFSSRN